MDRLGIDIHPKKKKTLRTYDDGVCKPCIFELIQYLIVLSTSNGLHWHNTTTMIPVINSQNEHYKTWNFTSSWKINASFWLNFHTTKPILVHLNVSTTVERKTEKTPTNVEQFKVNQRNCSNLAHTTIPVWNLLFRCKSDFHSNAE